MINKAKNNWKHQVISTGKNNGIINYCAEHMAILGSRSAVKKAIAGQRLLLNGKAATFSDVVKSGDLIQLSGAGIQQPKKFDFDLEIVYEDDFLLVVNKPGGIAVNGNRNKTVENAVAHLNAGNPQNDTLPRPVSVHRIDVPTSGLVLLAKTKTALVQMSRAFQENRVEKEYMAVVHGKTPETGVIDHDIQGKTAITRFETIANVPSRVFKHLSLVRLRLITGRTHQLRIHLKEREHLIVGDKLYADGQKTILGKGLFLCSNRMKFRHPQKDIVVDLQIDTPTKFIRLLQRENIRF